MSPLINSILLPDVRFLCLNKDQIFSSRKAVVRDNRSRDNESRLYFIHRLINFIRLEVIRFTEHK